jgi:DNA-binding transcriptional MerR regulator
MDDEWVELMVEAKAQGLTVEEIREWIEQNEKGSDNNE